MDRQTELELIDELLTLRGSESAFLDPATSTNPVEHYTSQARFDHERKAILRRSPIAAAHASELAQPGAFVRRDVAGVPVLITRDKAGEVRAFVNVCRHRGTRLVDEESGCRHRFSCPYHAWTYASSGELIAVPHFDEGFFGKEKSELSLKRLSCCVRFGFVWVTIDQDGQEDFVGSFGELATDLEALGMDDMKVVAEVSQTRLANWKLLVEGGIEAYHFRVAHRNTIGPHFEDNLSSYRSFGPHLRSILPRTSMAGLTRETRDDWRLRDHANILYTLFPTTQLLVQQDHVVWVGLTLLGPGETRVRVATLAPRSEASRKDHWARNQAITMTTLNEDFVIGESIQTGLESGANEEMLFGRFEGALGVFNRTVDEYLI